MKYLSSFFMVISFWAFGDVHNFEITKSNGRALKFKASRERVESCLESYLDKMEGLSENYLSRFKKENIDKVTTDLATEAFNHHVTNEQWLKMSSTIINFSVEKCIPYRKDDTEVDGWEKFNLLLDNSNYIINKAFDRRNANVTKCRNGEMRIGKYLAKKVNKSPLGEIVYEYGSIIGDKLIKTHSSFHTSIDWLEDTINQFKYSNSDFAAIDRTLLVEYGFAYNQIKSKFCRKIFPYHSQLEEILNGYKLPTSYHLLFKNGAKLEKSVTKGKRKIVKMMNWFKMVEDHFKKEELKNNNSLFRRELMKKIELDKI